MGKLLGQAASFAAPVDGLVRIAKKPQGRGGKSATGHPGILCGAEGQEAVLMGVMDGDTLLGMLA